MGKAGNGKTVLMEQIEQRAVLDIYKIEKF